MLVAVRNIRICEQSQAGDQGGRKNNEVLPVGPPGGAKQPSRTENREEHQRGHGHGERRIGLHLWSNVKDECSVRTVRPG